MITGLFSLLIVFTIGLILGFRWRMFLHIFLIAFFVRVIFIFYNSYVGDLFDSTADARTYENYAWVWAQDGFLNILLSYDGPSAHFITWPVALLYSIFGRSLIMAESLSLLFGILAVFLGWYISRKIWGEKIAMKVGWLAALYPPLVLYSCLVMRETYIYFFMLLAFFGTYNWSKHGGKKHFFIAILSFYVATHFHGGMFVGLIVFLGFVAFRTFKNSFYSFKRGKIHLNSFFIIILLMLSASYFFSSKVHVPKLGTIDDILDFSRVTYMTSHTTRGDASYPEWLEVKSVTELIYKGPLRSIYFLISPLPWDIKKTIHVLGFFDGLMYTFILFLIFINRKKIMKDPGLRNISIILIFFIFVFAIGVGNFGTGIRHRAKFFIAFLLLVAPLIPNFFFYRKNNNKYNK